MFEILGKKYAKQKVKKKINKEPKKSWMDKRTK